MSMKDLKGMNINELSTPRWLPHPNLCPDDAPPEEVLASLQVACQHHDPASRVMANIRAHDIIQAIDQLRARVLPPPSFVDIPQGPPNLPGHSDGQVLVAMLETLQEFQEGQVLDEDDIHTLKCITRLMYQLGQDRVNEHGCFEPRLKTPNTPRFKP